MLSKFNDKHPLRTLFGGSDEIKISVNGKVKDRFGEDLPTSLSSEGHVLVNVPFLGKIDHYRICDLVAIHFKDFDHLPISVYDQIEAFHIDSDFKNNHAGNIGYRFKGDRLEYPKGSGYYIIPGFPRRAINSNGELLSTKKNDKLKWYITKPQESKRSTGGYFTNRVEIDGQAMTLLRHRAMLLVFKGYPDNVDRLISNHIDGVPGNDALDNLEWVTYRENNIHSYKNNLRIQNKPVIARNVITGEEKVFFSVAECGRVIGIKDRTINYRLEHCKFSSVNSFGYQFKYLDNPREWIIPEDPEEAINLARQAMSIVAHFPNGDRVTYKSLSTASWNTGISKYRISEGAKNDKLVDDIKFEFAEKVPL